MRLHSATTRLALILVCLLTATFSEAATTIHVPADQPTIQSAINVASGGDTVLVAPGTYKENINFSGKAITLKSSGGAKVTIIDGGGIAPVVTFDSNETSTSVLSGFTLQNGDATPTAANEGGGIQIESASPTISSNIIQGNKGANGGGGIGLGFASPLIENNIIRNNTQSSLVSGGIGGGGISVRGASTAQIIGNTIENNTWPSSFGGGVSLFGAWAVLIKNNFFINNSCGDSGNAIAMANDVSETIIVQNVFIGNNATSSSSLYWSNSPAALVNNTIADGSATVPNFSLVAFEGLSSSTIVANNIIAATNIGTIAFDCVDNDIPNPANFYNNDVFSTQGSAYGGHCTNQTGTNGNISVNPLFVSKSNVRLKSGSPAIDAGNNSAPNLPTTDLAGNPRIINGNDGTTAIIDIGAYEFVPVVFAPKSLAFGLQPVGSTTTKVVKVTNAQDKSLNISSISVPKGYSVTGCGSDLAALTSCTLNVTFHPLTSGSFKGQLTVVDDAGNNPQTLGLSGSAH